MPTKFPSYIIKFGGNLREYPTNHFFSFHMWFSSHSITDDSICLWLFQHTLIRAIAKWYVDQPKETHSTLATLTTTFISYFQLPLYYDTVLNFWLHSFKLMSLTFPTMFKNFIEEGASVMLLTSKTQSIWIGFLDSCSTPLWKMSLLNFLNPRKKISR